MKICRLLAMPLAALFAVSLSLASCSGKGNVQQYDEISDSSEMTEEPTELSPVTLPDGEELTGDFNQAMNLVEEHADYFFPRLNELLGPVKVKAENGGDLSDGSNPAMERFLNINGLYFEALGIIMAYTDSPNLTDEQKARLDAFNKKYAEGLEDVDYLVKLADSPSMKQIDLNK